MSDESEWKFKIPQKVLDLHATRVLKSSTSSADLPSSGISAIRTMDDPAPNDVSTVASGENSSTQFILNDQVSLVERDSVATSETVFPEHIRTDIQPAVLDSHLTQTTMTLDKALRTAYLIAGCPDPDGKDVVTLLALHNECSDQEMSWSIQRWICGDIEAFDPHTMQPVLAPRHYGAIMPSWGFVSGKVILDMGQSVQLGTMPKRLALLGELRFSPTGEWSFALHNNDQSALRRIRSDRPVQLSVPFNIMNMHNDVLIQSSLLVNITRDPVCGLVVFVRQGEGLFHGAARFIIDLVQNALRSPCFCSGQYKVPEMSYRQSALCGFFQSAFTQAVPECLNASVKLGTPESQKLHDARAAIAGRLASMIFSKQRAMAILEEFRLKPLPVFHEFFPIGAVTSVHAKVQKLPVEQTDVERVSPPIQEKAVGGVEIVEDVALSTEHSAVADFSGEDIYVLMAQKLPELLPRSEVADLCKDLLGSQLIGKSTLEKLDMNKAGPPSVKIGGRVH